MPRAVVTGGAGFVGSHLCDGLLARGWSVVAVDDLSTGRRENVAHLSSRDDFELVVHDVTRGLPVAGPVHAVLHLASAASPPAYLARPIATLEVGALGTQHALELARLHPGSRFLLASTSEIYGDPQVDPQPETYWGNVNPVGPRSVYDEAKRYAEALTMAYHRTYGVDTKIVRIFNTYGPRLAPGDGRVVSNFVAQALRGEPLTMYGDGTQTRSFCFVHDEVEGLIRLLESAHVGPMNIGNPSSITMLELATRVRQVTGADVPVVHQPAPVDDPRQRRPDITLAREVLGWTPTTSLDDGLREVLASYRAAGVA